MKLIEHCSHVGGDWTSNKEGIQICSLCDQPAVGVYRDITNTTYQSLGCLSNSLLGVIAKSPAHLKYKVMSGEEPSEIGSVLHIGSAFHTLVLQPDRWDEDVAVLPDATEQGGKATWYRTIEGKEFKAAFLEENKSKAMIKHDQVSLLDMMAKSVYEDDLAGQYLEADALNELSIVFDYFGIRFRSRIDKLISGSADYPDVIVDLKTVRSGSMDDFARSVYCHGYYRAAHAYRESVEQLVGDRPVDVIFIAVEKEPPFCVGVYRLGQISINSGGRMNEKLINDYLECCRLDSWPGYTPEIRDLDLQEYQLNQAAEIYMEDKG